ncbi:hypothetical protein ACWCQZ_44755 [Streptomyces sp. NPDC002285]
MNAAHLVALVRAGALFDRGYLMSVPRRWSLERAHERHGIAPGWWGPSLHRVSSARLVKTLDYALFQRQNDGFEVELAAIGS